MSLNIVPNISMQLQVQFEREEQIVIHGGLNINNTTPDVSWKCVRVAAPRYSALVVEMSTELYQLSLPLRCCFLDVRILWKEAMELVR